MPTGLIFTGQRLACARAVSTAALKAEAFTQNTTISELNLFYSYRGEIIGSDFVYRVPRQKKVKWEDRRVARKISDAGFCFGVRKRIGKCV